MINPNSYYYIHLYYYEQNTVAWRSINIKFNLSILVYPNLFKNNINGSKVK